MKVVDDVRKCVGFIGFKMADESFRFAGSVFFLGYDNSEGKADPVFWITAKHVITKIKNLGINKICVRLNQADGDAVWIENIDINAWKFHPTDDKVDVAVFKFGIPDGFDHLVYPISRCVSSKTFEEHRIGIGEEVFVTGLFHHHSGSKRNIPIVRIGNIAALDEEKIQTKMGLIDGYLIEARSIGGLSGSPVFINLGNIRNIDGQIKFNNEGIFFMLGLIHGHYDVDSDEVDTAAVIEDIANKDAVNTGIAVVVPINKVLEVVESAK